MICLRRRGSSLLRRRKPRRAALLHLGQGHVRNLPDLGLHDLDGLNDVGKRNIAPRDELSLLLVGQGRFTNGLLDLIHNELRLVLIGTIGEDLYLGDLLNDKLHKLRLVSKVYDGSLYYINGSSNGFWCRCWR